MKLKTETLAEVSTKDLAKALYEAGPDVFAQLWFDIAKEFSAYTGENSGKIDDIAKAMAPGFGCLGRDLFQNLNQLIEYYIVKEKRDKD